MRSKIKSPRQLLPLLKRLREKGKRIVFTNGCFDLLHVGHVRYLERAKSLGDVLVVGLNSDRSIHRIKDHLRPITPQRQRAEVLSALGCVDFVTLFDEPDPEKLISLCLPDVLVKGADWSKERIIGRDLVEGHGGKVVTIPVVPRVSTTRIIHTIVKKYGKSEVNHPETPRRAG